MKTKIFILLFLNLSLAFSQVLIVSTENMQYSNGTGIDACSTIDFGADQEITISFWAKLEKPLNMATGDGNIEIMISNIDDYNSGTSIYSEFLASSSWSDDFTYNISTYTNYLTVTLQASSFNTTGGIFFLKYTSSSNIKYYSCKFSIIKNETPTFTISPITTSVSCNSTSSKTFMVDNVNNSPGSLEYHLGYKL